MAVMRTRIHTPRLGKRGKQLPVVSWLLAGAAGAGVGAAMFGAVPVASAQAGAESSSDAAPASSSARAVAGSGKLQATVRPERGSTARAAAAVSGTPVTSIPLNARAVSVSRQLPAAGASIPVGAESLESRAAQVNAAGNVRPALAAATSGRAASGAATPASVTPIAAKINVGDSPTRVVVSPDGNTAYVLNSVSRTVSVINVNDNTKVKDISLGTAVDPTSLAISEDGNYVYVANASQRPGWFGFTPPSPLLSVINTASNSVTKTSEINTLAVSILKPVLRAPSSIAVSNGSVYVTSMYAKAPSYLPVNASSWSEFSVSDNLAKEILNCSSARCPAYGATESIWSKINRIVPSPRELFGIGGRVALGKLASTLSFGLIEADLSAINTAPVDVAVAPTAGQNYIYSVNSANDFVYVFDPVTRSMVDAVFLGTMKVKDNTLTIGMNTVPTKIKFGRDDETVAYVLNSGSKELVRLNIDPANIKAGRGVQIIDRIPLTNDKWITPIDMAISPDGKYAYIITKQAVLEDPKDRSAKKPASTDLLTIVNLTDNTVTETVLPIDKSTELTGIAVTGTKALITTRPDTLIRQLWSQIWKSGNGNQVMVVDLTSLVPAS